MQRRLIALAGVATAAIGVSAAVWRTYRREIRRERQRVSSGSQVVETTLGPIEYAVRGAGPPVLVVHGAGGGFDQGLDFGSGLVERGFLIVAPSRFGYLRTPLPANASIAAQADAHAALLDRLGIARAAILGASAGALSAVEFALRHPERCTALVALVPAGYVPRAAGEAPMQAPASTRLLLETVLGSDFLFWLALRCARRTLTRAILATPPQIVDAAAADEQKRVERILRQLLPVRPRRPGLRNDVAVIDALGPTDLASIAVPTLAISLADDLFGTYEIAEFISQQVPGARFIGFPTGGHMWVGRHREVMAGIAAFLEQEASGGQPA